MNGICGREIYVKKRDNTILENVNIAVKPGEFVAVVGPSGAGKSTLLKILTGELRPDSGEVIVNGRPLHRWSTGELAKKRAVLPQSSRPGFSFPVIDVVLLGRGPYGNGTSKKDYEIALNALNRAGIGELASRDYATLSGGEQQRVQFARTLAQVDVERIEPRYLLLDEPTSSLDVKHAWSILENARSLLASGVGVFCILHDLNLAASFADRIILLTRGKVLATGSPREVLTSASIEDAFGFRVDIMDHPRKDAPLIVMCGN